MLALTPVRRIRKAIMKDLGLPEDVLQFVNYPTRFDCREAERLLQPGGITVPPLEDYAWRLWDYWERHLDPDLFIDRSLRGHGRARSCSSPAALRASARRPRSSLPRPAPSRSSPRADTEKLEADASRRPRRLRPAPHHLCRRHRRPGSVRRAGEQDRREHMAASTSSSTMPAARSAAASRTPSTACTISSALMQLNYFGCAAADPGFPAGNGQEKARPCHQHLVDRRAHQRAALFRLCRLESGAGGVDALRRVGIPRSRRPFHDRSTCRSCARAMIAPTKFYEHVPTLTPEEAADLVVEAIIHRADAHRDASRHFRTGGPRRRPAHRADHHEHRFPHVSGFGGGQGRRAGQ